MSLHTALVKIEEEKTSSFAFASVVAIRDINEGEKLTEQNLWVRRPGGGDYTAADYENLIGKMQWLHYHYSWKYASKNGDGFSFNSLELQKMS